MRKKKKESCTNLTCWGVLANVQPAANAGIYTSDKKCALIFGAGRKNYQLIPRHKCVLTVTTMFDSLELTKCWHKMNAQAFFFFVSIVRFLRGICERR